MMGEDKNKVQGRKESAGAGAGAWYYTRQREVVSAALATIVLHPIDTVKVRMQCSEGSGLRRVIANMLKNEGSVSFYKGLSAGLLRQATYTAVNFTSFRILFTSTTSTSSGDDDEKKSQHSSYRKLMCSLSAGAIAACVCGPTDLVVTRMQADATLPAALSRNYRNVIHGLYEVISKEGVLALWKGTGASVLRTMALGFGLVASNECLGFFERRYLRHDSSSSSSSSRDARILAGLLVCGVLPPAMANPFDYVKVQLQMMQPQPGDAVAINGRSYSSSTGLSDCAMNRLKLQGGGGPRIFYTGFPAFCFTFFPHMMLTFLLSSQLRQGLQLRF